MSGAKKEIKRIGEEMVETVQKLSESTHVEGRPMTPAAARHKLNRLPNSRALFNKAKAITRAVTLLNREGIDVDVEGANKIASNLRTAAHSPTAEAGAGVRSLRNQLELVLLGEMSAKWFCKDLNDTTTKVQAVLRD